MQQIIDRIGAGKTRVAAAAIVFAAALTLYLFTLAPTVTLVDSGELNVTAAKLGVAHPPGLPDTEPQLESVRHRGQRWTDLVHGEQHLLLVRRQSVGVSVARRRLYRQHVDWLRAAFPRRDGA